MKKYIKILSLVLALVMSSLCLASCFGEKDGSDKGSGGTDFLSSNKLKEDTKYFFDHAEVNISFDNYFNYRDSMSQDQYDSFCQMIREECQAKMNEDALEHVFYIQKEDGSYEKLLAFRLLGTLVQAGLSYRYFSEREIQLQC